MSSFFKELKRRHVIKAGLAYLVSAWLIIQVLSILLPAFDAEDWILRTAVIVLIVGLPVWLILSWFYDFSSKGVELTEDEELNEEAYSRKNVGLNRFIIVTLSIAVVLLIFNQVRLSQKYQKGDDDRISLAVLPFENFSPDQENNWIGDGITVDLINNLSLIKDFKVIPRASVMRFKDIDLSIPEMAKAMGVYYLMEGSVRKEGNEILITTNLIDRNERQIWHVQFREKPEKIMDLQSDVAERIARKMLGEITESQRSVIESFRKINPEALKNLELGDKAYDRQIPALWLDAKAFYEKAVELEPDWPQALARLAFMEVYYNRERGDSLAEQALSLDPKLDRAWTTKAISLVQQEQFERAESILLEAVEKIDEAPWSHDYLASHYLFRKPDFEKALYHAAQAIKIDPLNLYFIRRQIFALLSMERFKEADSLLNEKRIFISNEVLTHLKRWKVEKIAEKAFRETHSYDEVLNVLESSADTIPDDRAYYLMEIGKANNKYYNDNGKYLEYVQKAWNERETVEEMIIDGKIKVGLELVHAMLENAMLKEARAILDSDEIAREIEDPQKNWSVGLKREAEWRYYLSLGDLFMAQEYVDGDVLKSTLLDAHAGKRESVYRSLRDKTLKNPAYRAQVFAVLKETDSLFYCLKNDNIDAPFVNSHPVFDPYREDPRFIIFRKAHSLEDRSIE